MPWHWQVRGPRPRFIYDNDEKKKELKIRIPFDAWLEQKKKNIHKTTRSTIGKKETKASSSANDKAFQEWLKTKRLKTLKVVKKKKSPPQADLEEKRARKYSEWLERKRNEAKELKKRRTQQIKRDEKDAMERRQVKWRKKPLVVAYSKIL